MAQLLDEIAYVRELDDDEQGRGLAWAIYAEDIGLESALWGVAGADGVGWGGAGHDGMGAAAASAQAIALHVSSDGMGSATVQIPSHRGEFHPMPSAAEPAGTVAIAELYSLAGGLILGWTSTPPAGAVQLGDKEEAHQSWGGGESDEDEDASQLAMGISQPMEVAP